MLAPDQVSYLINPSVCAGGSFFFAVGPFGPAAFFISLSRGRVAAGVMQQKTQKGAINGQQKYESGRVVSPLPVMRFEGPTKALSFQKAVFVDLWLDSLGESTVRGTQGGEQFRIGCIGRGDVHLLLTDCRLLNSLEMKPDVVV